MNIFMVDKNPRKAAEALVDKHVVKMILESAQLLSTAHRVLDGKEINGKSKSGRNQKQWVLPDSRDYEIYQATHVNHPSAIWCRASLENYAWLVDHFFALMDEYTFRYKKIHKCYGQLSFMLSSPPLHLRTSPFTEIPCCMPEEYIISDDPITNYRNYYNTGKSHIHSWKKRLPPEWITK